MPKYEWDRFYLKPVRTEPRQTVEDQRILDGRGPDGPMFNGSDAVRCRDYDEHRELFYRIDGRWMCRAEECA